MQRARGWNSFIIVSGPNAERFYLKRGIIKVGGEIVYDDAGEKGAIVIHTSTLYASDLRFVYSNSDL